MGLKPVHAIKWHRSETFDQRFNRTKLAEHAHIGLLTAAGAQLLLHEVP